MVEIRHGEITKRYLLILGYYFDILIHGSY
jgi:hypothetical protein